MGLGVNPHRLTPLDRLRYVGSRGMGVLQYHPEIVESSKSENILDLDILANECLQVQMNDDDQYIDELFVLNGSSAGARPKILVSVNSENNQIALGDNKTSHPHNDWIIKLRSSVDPQDIGSIEYAYHLMAKAAGLNVPEAKLFKSTTAHGYFGVKRFDREEHQFLHAHTLSGLLHADYRLPCLDYSTILKATYILTKSHKEVETQFRNAVYNVFSHNRDDHAKNFSFIMTGSGDWKVSPAYDLTFSNGPRGEHCTSVMGNGKNPGTQELLKLGAQVGLNKANVETIIAEIKDAVSCWSEFASEAGVSARSKKFIQTQLKINQ
jgi:serine/threonine-protein kinase HipA